MVKQNDDVGKDILLLLIQKYLKDNKFIKIGKIAAIRKIFRR
jgi:hypothetical protein